jgi:NADPH:quinone reductase-like Zn-dependent oxidoreductase
MRRELHMKAAVYTRFGPPMDVLEVGDVDKPTINGNEVLVKIHAASVNFGDWSFVRGKPFIVRLMGAGLLGPRNKILGSDVAGRVESVGGDVKRFQPGDDVMGELASHGWGGFAEYVVAPEDVLALKPANLTYEEAAAVPQAATVALHGLRNEGQVQPGQSVLVIGASGGIGTYAVQIAKALGAEVTGVCSTRNLDLVRSLGADHVIDYTKEDFSQNEGRYDLIIDVVANRPMSEYMRALTPRGKYVAVAFNPGSLFARTGDKKARALTVESSVDDLVFIKGLIEAGEVVPVIDRRYPLSEVAEALSYYGERHSRGKVVITVEHT